jgi:hypothetical protein
MKLRILLLFLFAVAMACAQEAKVRTTLATNGELWIGQRETLVVELLAPGYFSGAPSFDLPNAPGLLVVPPSGRPVVSNETIDGTTYTVQRHELAVFARRAGEQTIPSFTVRFQFKRNPLDKEPAATAVKTEPVHFIVKVPAGAEKLGNIISARNLTVDETWAPNPHQAKAGDAFTRTITYSAPDIPAMAFPPFPAGKIDGLGIYPKPPEVFDESDRGSLTGRRRDTIVYVCQRAGRFTIPEARLTWFDLDAQQLRVIHFPAQTFEVAPNPAMAMAAAQNAVPPAHYSAGFWMGMALVVLGLAVLLAPAALWSWLLAPFRPVHLSPLNPQFTFQAKAKLSMNPMKGSQP